MKILAFSDLHLGAGQDHRGDALADQSRVLEQIATLAFERNVDLILNAGDTFHRAKPAPAELHVFKRFCEALAALGIPMVAIGGNGMHDAAPGQKSALELFESPLVRVSRTPEMIAFPGGGPNQLGVAVCTLPAAALGHLAAAGNGVPRADLAERAVDLLLGCARQLYADAPDDRPRILLAHQMVSGASLPTGLPVEQVGSVVLPLWALEEQGWDAIALGDIHKAQILQDVPFIAYCGAPMRHDFGEQENKPGVWILDADTEGADYEFVRLEDRRFVTVDVDLVAEADAQASMNAKVAAGELTQTWAISSDETDWIAVAIGQELPLTDAVVRVRYRATEEQHRRVDHAALQRLVMDAGAHRLYGGVAWEPVRETRTRASGLDESLPPLAAVDLWLAANTVDDGQAAALRALLAGWLETV